MASDIGTMAVDAMSLAGHPVPMLPIMLRMPYGMHITSAQNVIDSKGSWGGGRRASRPGHSGSAIPMQHRHLMSAPPMPLSDTRSMHRRGGAAIAGMEETQADAMHRTAEAASTAAPRVPVREGESMYVVRAASPARSVRAPAAPPPSHDMADARGTVRAAMRVQWESGTLRVRRSRAAAEATTINVIIADISGSPKVIGTTSAHVFII